MRIVIVTCLILSAAPSLAQTIISGQVAAERPRIFLTPETLDAWRARFDEIPELRSLYDTTRSYMAARTPSTNPYVGGAELLAFAVFYMAEDRSPQALNAARPWMDMYAGGTEGDHWGHPLITKSMSVAFDWFYPDLTASERQRYGEAIVRYADLSLAYADHNAPPPGATWANQVSDYFNQFYWHQGRVPFAGIALAGEAGFDSDAQRYLGLAREWLWDHMLAPTNQAGEGGGWFESMGYNQMTANPLADLLEAWRTSTGEDLFPHSTWLPGNAAWVKHSLIPHSGFYVPLDDVRVGAKPSTGQDAVGSFSPLLAARYQDGFAQHFVKMLYPSQYAMWHVPYLLWYDPDIPVVDFETTAKGVWFKGLGQVNVRSGWDTDDTFAIYRAGNVYGGHGHYSSGHFLIYRKGDLLVEDGDYGSKSPDAHNTLYIGGEMRELARSTPQHYRANMDGSTYDFGEITRYAHDDAFALYDWVDSDLTRAYTPQQAEHVTRRFVYLHPQTFLLIDHIQSPPGVAKRFRLHAPVAPQINSSARTATWQESAGRLHVQTLLPANALLTTAREDESHLLSVSNPQPSENDVFVHVLHAADLSEQAPVSSPVSGSDGFSGVTVGSSGVRWTVLWRSTGVSEEVTYTASGTEPVRHLVSDLDGEAFRITGPGAPEEVVTPQEGHPLFFETPSGGTFEIVAVDPSTGSLPTAPADLFPDFDDDGTVGFPDFLLFAGRFGASEGEERFETVYDLDESGEIDFGDFLLFAATFGRTSELAAS
jgi:hypothetical protein